MAINLASGNGKRGHLDQLGIVSILYTERDKGHYLMTENNLSIFVNPKTEGLPFGFSSVD